jgi:hypothetical protein
VRGEATAHLNAEAVQEDGSAAGVEVLRFDAEAHGEPADDVRSGSTMAELDQADSLLAQAGPLGKLCVRPPAVPAYPPDAPEHRRPDVAVSSPDGLVGVAAARPLLGHRASGQSGSRMCSGSGMRTRQPHMMQGTALPGRRSSDGTHSMQHPHLPAGGAGRCSNPIAAEQEALPSLSMYLSVPRP